ncbi:cupin domain-containing protein [uncultured Aquimarina sp.]|uniref:cupin domain-containing protein n=1 Tax=uncultured Aquimarina sp. TaxID=575652 RepID=UPI002615BF17|nr:cupin domain-containing protein [uncultured Aquimarina sp.]
MENLELEKSFTHNLVDIVDYLPGSVVMKAILKKKTGTVSVLSFDHGEELPSRILPFDNLIQVIAGVAEIIINDKLITIETGQTIIIPAHARNVVKANKRFKMLSTIIKSGYEDVSI